MKQPYTYYTHISGNYATLERKIDDNLRKNNDFLRDLDETDDKMDDLTLGPLKVVRLA